MRQLLSEILKFVELELSAPKREISDELKKLVASCNNDITPKYTAVDSGYVVQRVGEVDILIQSIVAIGDEVKRRFIIQKVLEDPHHDARINEIHFAESFRGLVVVDGPLTPYVNGGDVVGVSKEPKAVRYGPRIPEKELRELFINLSKALGEIKVAGELLAEAPRGSYLRPVEVGGFYGTFFKSDWVLYVEFPKGLDASEICGLFRRYPIKLRIAHHLSKINRQYLDSIKLLFSNIGKVHYLHLREIL
ncbi:MAG: DNA double-strand break repair nuclease NurA [Pyrobaculum sp.]